MVYKQRKPIVFISSYLDGISTSVTFFRNKFMDDEIKKRVDETRDQLASNKMAYDINVLAGWYRAGCCTQYIESFFQLQYIT